MIAKVRTEYVVMCSTEAPSKVVEKVAKELSQAILEDEKLKDLGIDLDTIIGNLFE